MRNRPLTAERIWAAAHNNEAHTVDEVASALRMAPTRELHEMINSMVIAGNLRRSIITKRLVCGTRPEPVRRRQPARAGAGMPTRPRPDPDRAPDTAAAAMPHAPAAVIPGVVPQQRRSARVDYEPEWLTGVPEEDRRVKHGICPYQIQPAGWGQREIFCGAQRSPNEADGPYCPPHAARLREDYPQHCHGGYVW